MAKLFDSPKFERTGEHFYGNAAERFSAPLLAEIESIPESDLLQQGADSLGDELALKHSLIAPKLKEASITVEDTSIEVSDPVGQKSPGTRIRYFLPFEGRGDILECSPSNIDTRRHWQVEIVGNDIILTYETTKNDPAEIKAKFKEHIQWIRDGFTSLKYDLENTNKAMKAEAKKRLQARINLLTDQDWAKSLGFPRRNPHES